jgi:hypothetical protein
MANNATFVKIVAGEVATIHNLMAIVQNVGKRYSEHTRNAVACGD